MSLDNSKTAILKMIKSALTDRKCELPSDYDMSYICKTAKSHQIISLVYYGALNCGVPDDSPQMQELFNKTCIAVSKCVGQDFEINRVFEAFSENGIDYMPLKGTVLRSLYSKPEMRQMSDADILIREEQKDKCGEVLSGLGFTYKLESDHEVIWYNESLYLELHKRVIPSYNKDYYKYFGDGWKLATVKNGNRYDMNDNDAFIYIFTHFAKHYRDAGVGIRHITELWVYKNSKQLDENYICKELKKLQLYDFYKNVSDTLAFWFEGGEETDVTDFITEVIFSSGSYGQHAEHVLSKALKREICEGEDANKKGKNIITVIFLPYKRMCILFPILERVPVLLPFMWVARWIKTVLFKKSKIVKISNDIKAVSDENIDSYRSSLRYVGLDFNFEE